MHNEPEALPAANQIAVEVARLLRDSDVFPVPRPQRSEEWVEPAEAARMMGYSTSRFYHIYSGLGIIPSRTSRRKMLFRTRDIEATLLRLQRRPRGRSRRAAQLTQNRGNYLGANS